MGRQDYQWIHEPILYGWKEAEGGHYFINDRTNATVQEEKPLNIKKLTKEELRIMLEKILSSTKTTTIRCDRPTRSLEHPTMKPIKLCAELIYNSSRYGEIVYDAFNGSGSTMIAAEQLERKCYALEIDPVYCDVAVKRYVEYKGNDNDVFLIREGKRIPYIKVLEEG